MRLQGRSRVAGCRRRQVEHLAGEEVRASEAGVDGAEDREGVDVELGGGAHPLRRSFVRHAECILAGFADDLLQTLHARLHLVAAERDALCDGQVGQAAPDGEADRRVFRTGEGAEVPAQRERRCDGSGDRVMRRRLADRRHERGDELVGLADAGLAVRLVGLLRFVGRQ